MHETRFTKRTTLACDLALVLQILELLRGQLIASRFSVRSTRFCYFLGGANTAQWIRRRYGLSPCLTWRGVCKATQRLLL